MGRPYRDSKFTTCEEFDAFNDLFVTFINRGPRDLLTPRVKLRCLEVSPSHRGEGGQHKQTGAICLLLSQADKKLNLSMYSVSDSC